MNKVYCNQCRNYIYCEYRDTCMVPGKMKDTYKARQHIQFDPARKNKNNDCKDDQFKGAVWVKR